MGELEGTTLGRYRLQHCIGRGGMSEVYLATDEYMQRDVALKLVDSNHADYSERFQREVQTIGRLSHSHILPAFDYGEQGPWQYLVMPYVEHGTLRELLASGPLSLEEAGAILEQIASALQFAHDHGIIHRDIKPSNILLDSQRHVYLADFGLAKVLGKNTEITQGDYLLGSPEYMAPELVDEPASTSSDIYALGIVLYEMLTGRVPFKGATPLGVCWKHLQEQPLYPSLLNPAIPHPIEQVILCTLEKDPHRRFKSARALVHAYKSALKVAQQPETLHVLASTYTQPISNVPDPVAIKIPSVQQALPQGQQRISRVHRMIAALIALVLL